MQRDSSKKDQDKPAKEKEIPHGDPRLLAWQNNMCKDNVVWMIYWQIAYWERQKKFARDKPSELCEWWDIPKRRFFRAMDLGESLGLFKRLGEKNSHCRRGWKTCLKITGFDSDNRPTTERILEAWETQ